MAEVQAVIHDKKYATYINTGTNSLIADEPLEHGGGNEGFSPTELLAAALAACTSITLRMYADRKEYALEKIEVNVSLTRDTATNITSVIRNITTTGNMKEDERKRLLEIANSCPVHKILSNQITIKTELI